MGKKWSKIDFNYRHQRVITTTTTTIIMIIIITTRRKQEQEQGATSNLSCTWLKKGELKKESD